MIEYKEACGWLNYKFNYLDFLNHPLKIQPRDLWATLLTRATTAIIIKGLWFEQTIIFITTWGCFNTSFKFWKNANNILIPKYFPLKEGLVFPFNKLELSIRKCNKKVYTVQTDWQTQGLKKSSWQVKKQTISCYFYVHCSNCLKNIKL